MVAVQAGFGLIFASFFVAMVFSVLSLPALVASWRPEWVALLVIYWVIRAPHRVGIFTALIVGILLDVLEGKALGASGLSLSVVAYLVLSMHQRIRMFPLIQQSFMVFMVIGINLMIGHLIRNVVAEPVSGFDYLLPAVTSAVLWPFIYLFMERMIQLFR